MGQYEYTMADKYDNQIKPNSFESDKEFYGKSRNLCYVNYRTYYISTAILIRQDFSLVKTFSQSLIYFIEIRFSDYNP